MNEQKQKTFNGLHRWFQLMIKGKMPFKTELYYPDGETPMGTLEGFYYRNRTMKVTKYTDLSKEQP